MLRSAIAIVAGYLTMLIGVMAFFAFVVFVAFGGPPGDPKTFEPPAWLVALELVVTPILAGLGGYVCAWIARRKPMQHALVLVGVMVVLGVFSVITDRGAKPLWSSIAVPALGCLAVPVGARVRRAHADALG
jgi:hypothetical protein